MAGINSRSKGCRAERMAAESFKKWAKQDFARTPSSGGLHWKSSNVKGDIVCTSEGHYFPFCIEVKSYAEAKINLAHLIVGKKDCIVHTFWEQCLRDAKRANKTPILIMRYNGLPKEEWIVVVDIDFFQLLKQANPVEWRTEMNYIVSVKDGWALMNSKHFFSSSYKSIKKLLKSKK